MSKILTQQSTIASINALAAYRLGVKIEKWCNKKEIEAQGLVLCKEIIYEHTVGMPIAVVWELRSTLLDKVFQGI